MTALNINAVSKRMMQVSSATQKAQKIAVQRAAIAAKEVQLAGLEADAPGGRLRNVGRNGAKLGVGYKLKGASNKPSAIVEATGKAWPILNNTTKPHKISPHLSAKTARIAFEANIWIGALRLPDGGFRRSVNHPGTKGKHTWEKAQPAAGRAAVIELNKTMVHAVQLAFKG